MPGRALRRDGAAWIPTPKSRAPIRAMVLRKLYRKLWPLGAQATKTREVYRVFLFRHDFAGAAKLFRKIPQLGESISHG
jgi:hypothetical protein